MKDRCLDVIVAVTMAVCEALGHERMDIDRLYIELGSEPHIHRSPGEPFTLTDRIWDRYIYEDTPFGTMMISSVATQLGLLTPVCDSVWRPLSAIILGCEMVGPFMLESDIVTELPTMENGALVVPTRPWPGYGAGRTGPI